MNVYPKGFAMRYNKLGLFIFALGILAFLGSLMLTWLGFFI